MDMSYKNISIYLFFIFSLSWTIQFLALFTTSGINSDEAELFLVLTMLIPTIVTTILLIKDRSLRHKILWKPNLNIFFTVFMGIFIPTMMAFIIVMISSFFGFGNSEWFKFTSNNVKITGGPWLLGIGTNTWLHTITNIFLTAIMFSLMNALPAAGEEFTWRGFLQGILIEKFGISKGIIILGLIWSFWHLPSLLAGYNYPDYPILGSFVFFPLKLVAVSFFYTWLTLSSKSFIPAAIAHGAGNSIKTGVISNIKLQSSIIYIDLSEIIITVVIGLFFWLLLTKRMK